MCIHDEKTDSEISAKVRNDGHHEKRVSLTIRALLNRLRERNKKAIFLDVGANLGMHALYAAKLGYPVWAVEPQRKNAIKVWCENRISNLCISMVV